jgi:osmotically-inducible protein OsmY
MRDAAIDVVDEGGVITLKGTVATDELRQAAEEIIKQEQNVIQVINELRIESDSGAKDTPVVVVAPDQVH